MSTIRWVAHPFSAFPFSRSHFHYKPSVAVVERETLRTYHGIGRLVIEHLLAPPAAYGEQTVTRLAADAGLGKSISLPGGGVLSI